MTAHQHQPLVLLDEQPADKAWVRISGPGFLKTGYLIWHPGLTLASIEDEIGYNRSFGPLILVRIFRHHQRIYERKATEALHGVLNAGPITPKADAPELRPGDIVSADRCFL